MPLRLIVAALLFLPLTLPADAAPRSGVVVSAHRGGAAYAPENTMVAFRNATRMGVDELETDVQLTKDGVLVLLHDDTLDRTTNCKGAVSATTMAALQTCDAGYWWSPGPSQTTPDDKAPHPMRGRNVHVPKLAELLTYAKRLGRKAPRLSIEIKDIPGESNFDPAGTQVAAALVPALQASGIPKDKLLVQSFFPTALEAVKRLDPTLATQFLTSSSTGQTATMNLAYVTANKHQVMAPDFTAPDLTSELIGAAHTAGRRVLAYTPNTEAAQRAMLAKGVDGLITDRPACLLQILGRRVPKNLSVAGTVTACEN